MKRSIVSKLMCFALAVTLAIGSFATLIGCNGGKKLATPENPAVSGEGVITWDLVKNAEEYLITTSDGMYISYDNTYTLPDPTKGCTITIIAKASEYKDSDPSEAITFTPSALLPGDEEKPAVTIRAESFSVKSEGELTLGVDVVGLTDKSVTWSLLSGSEYVTLDGNGKITAKKIENKNQMALVRATSKEDPTVYAERQIYVVARQYLTQAMLDQLKTDRVDFSGMLDIDYYTTDLIPVYDGSAQLSLTTGMDTDQWYAAYQNSVNGVLQYINYENVGGYCNQVGISLTNTKEYFPVYDEGRHREMWATSGLYNTFNVFPVTLSNFVFNTETWRYDYSVDYDDDGMPIDPLGNFMNYTVSAANPHNYTPKNMSLIIDEGQIIGIYSESLDDSTVMNQRIAKMRMTVGINVGKYATVREAEMFSHIENDEFSHDKLQRAIDKTRARTSYKLEFRKQETMPLAGNVRTYTGYDEYVTENMCYFKPFTFNPSDADDKYYISNGEYGYKKIDGEDGDLYNSFDKDKMGKYEALRAFEAEFDNAKPSFAFAAEIFTSYAVSDDGEYTIYFVDPTMMTVATTFYNDLGNDAKLYGLYASMPWVGFEISMSNFSPMLVVDNATDSIVEIMFYYNLYYLYGYIDIRLSDFDFTGKVFPDGVKESDITFATRHIPTEWSQVYMIDDMGTEDTSDDEEVVADQYLIDFFDDEDVLDKIPFIGNALGDSYGFGLKQTRNFAWHILPITMLSLYFDVPVDNEYSINSSIEAIEAYITSDENGYVLAEHGVYKKGDYNILIQDENLDLFVYIWKDDLSE